MARPKIRPEDRQRSSKACLACKASKIRCDAQLPCASCIKRHKADSCIYAEVDRRRTHSLLNRGHRRPTESRAEAVLTPPNNNASPRGGGPNPCFSSTPEASRSSHDGTLNLHLDKDHLMPTPANRKDYDGESTTSSFLHFLRQILRPYVGSMPFTDGERQNYTVEPDIIDETSDVLDVQPEQMYSLLEYYFEGTSGLLDLFTADEIDALIAERTLFERPGLSSSAGRDDTAALDVALAIGAQVRGSSESSSQLEKAYVYRAQQIAFQGMLTNQSLHMVRLFLLLGFYMLGSRNKNTACMYLGVAANAAVVLGLHQPASYKNIQQDEHNARLRTWNSLRNIDILTSFVVGKPKSLPVLGHDISQTQRSGIEASSHVHHAFDATLKGCSLLEHIVAKLNKGNMLHVPTAKGLLEELRQWSQGLPRTLRQFSFASSNGASLESADRQLLAGNMHVSGVYYFAVMLVTRPYLIAYLMSRLRGRAPDQLISDPDEASDIKIKNNEVSKLAQVCVSSAIYLTEMCRKAKASNFTFGNLCLLKAWIFAAGLILGFSMYAGEPRKDIEDSFEAAREVLGDIGTRSSQARLYHEILTDFAEAVRKYHQRVAGEIRRTVQHYMDQILLVDVSGNDSEPSHPYQSPISAVASGNLDEQSSDTTNNAIVDENILEMAGTEEVQPLVDRSGHEGLWDEWGDLDMQLTPDFILSIEPLEPFYCAE